MLKANVKISGNLEDFIRSQISDSGLYETTSEYLRDLVRQDMRRQEAKAWSGLNDELSLGMSAPRSAFTKVTASDVISRNQK